MRERDNTAEPEPTGLGRALARWGLYIVGFAMVVGFVIGVGMNLLDDPEEPAAIYGKLFAVVLALMVLGIVVATSGAVINALQPRPTGPPTRRNSVAPPADLEGDADATEDEPPAQTKSWDDAFSGAHRRR